MEELRVELKNNDQNHLLAFWEKLSPDEQKQLYGDLRSIDYPEVMRYFKACTRTTDEPAEKVDDHLQPIPAVVLGSVTRTDADTLAAYQKEGETSSSSSPSSCSHFYVGSMCDDIRLHVARSYTSSAS